MAALWVRLALVVAMGVAAIAVPVVLNQATAGGTPGQGVARFFWVGIVGGVLARLVGRGWRDWLVFLAAILAAATVDAFVVVYRAPLQEQILGSILVFGLVAVPASIGWGLTAIVLRRLRRSA